MVARVQPSLRRPARDLTLARFESAEISLHELFLASLKAGSDTIRFREFVNCRLVGPSVMVAGVGVMLEGCDLGAAKGDVRTLLWSPQSPQYLTGGIHFEASHFKACTFFAVGFTGAPEFLQAIAASTRV